uniref:AN1-type domain-containing protein n=1 Tax=Macrostomum lignano TaxID=282301 RepID=A0A1I8IGH0_9PLAT
MVVYDLYHSRYDTVRLYRLTDPGGKAHLAAVHNYIGIAYSLLDRPILPTNLTSYATEIDEAMSHLYQLAENASLILARGGQSRLNSSSWSALRRAFRTELAGAIDALRSFQTDQLDGGGTGSDLDLLGQRMLNDKLMEVQKVFVYRSIYPHSDVVNLLAEEGSLRVFRRIFRQEMHETHELIGFGGPGGGVGSGNGGDGSEAKQKNLEKLLETCILSLASVSKPEAVPSGLSTVPCCTLAELAGSQAAGQLPAAVDGAELSYSSKRLRLAQASLQLTTIFVVAAAAATVAVKEVASAAALLSTIAANLCQNGCGFYGSTQFDGMCSVCHKENMKKRQKQDEEQIQKPTSSPHAAALLCASSSLPQSAFGAAANQVTAGAAAAAAANTNEDSHATAAAESSASVGVPLKSTASVAAAKSAEVASVDSSAGSSSGSSAQSNNKKSNRCGMCKKKVGLTGFACRCGGLFCSMHRYSDKHECPFDYQSHGQEEIRKANPQVVSTKIDKL